MQSKNHLFSRSNFSINIASYLPIDRYVTVHPYKSRYLKYKLLLRIRMSFDYKCCYCGENIKCRNIACMSHVYIRLNFVQHEQQGKFS